jgi:phosphatidylinositol alpha-1,6-mannosyltransferase
MMRVTLIATVVFDGPSNAMSTVNQQVIRQLDRCAGEHSKILEIEVWSLHDVSKTPEELERRLSLGHTRISCRGFAGSKWAMLASATVHRARQRIILNMHLGLSPISRLIRGSGSRVYQFLHGVECWRPLSPCDHWSFGAIDVLIANSESTYERFLSWNPGYRGLPSTKCWLGLSRDFHFDAKPVPTAGEEGTVLIVSRLARERYKGHEQLLAVWPRVRARVPNARLDIVGDGDDRTHLEQTADELGLRRSGAVRFWGHLEGRALEERFQRCAVFAMPSTGEGFGLVYVEALASGKPVVASLEDAAREIVKHGHTGLLVHQSDLGGLAEAICRLLENASLRNKMGVQGRQRVLEHFTERAFGDRLYAALTRLGGGGERP